VLDGSKRRKYYKSRVAYVPLKAACQKRIKYKTFLDSALAAARQSASAGRQQEEKILQVQRGVGAGEGCLPGNKEV
jgi:hypothetical protein